MSEHLDQMMSMLRTIWVDAQPERMHEFFAASNDLKGLIPEFNLAPAEVSELVSAMLQHITCDRVDVVKAVEQGEWLASTIQFQMRRIDTGTLVRPYAILMSRQLDGQIVESYCTFDFLRFFEMLGLAPANSLPLCLSGHRLQ